MTDALQKEARAAAVELEYGPDNFDFIGGYERGYLAAATAREKEIEELRAKLEAVPVEEIKIAAAALRTFGAVGGTHSRADTIDRWLATVTK